MKLTVESLVKSLDRDVDTSLGPLGSNGDGNPDYSRVAMMTLIAMSSVAMLAAVYLAVVGGALAAQLVGVLLFVFCYFAVISLIKEKANLDLLTRNFQDLSEDSKKEILYLIAQSSSSTSSGFVKVIELLLNVISGTK